MRPSYNSKDALLIRSGAFPAAAGTVYTEVLDLGDIGERGVRTDPCELLVSSPALTAVQLPVSSANAFSIQYSDTKDFAEAVTWTCGTPWQQSGSADGAEAFERRFRPATDAPRYVRVQCVCSGTSALSGLKFELALVS